MRWWILLLILLFGLAGCGSNSTSKDGEVRLETLDQRHFRLHWSQDSAIFKIKDNFELQMIHNTSAVPGALMALVQSLAWLTNPNYQSQFNMYKHYKNVREVSEQISPYRLSFYTIVYAFKLKNLDMLKSIEEFVYHKHDLYSPYQITRLLSLMYFYMALVAEEWTDQKDYLIKATAYEGQDRTLKNYAQIFSLSILKMSINYYKDQLDQLRYYRKLGMDEVLEDGRLEAGEIFGQSITNTFNLIRYNIPQYTEGHEKSVNELLAQMNQYVNAIDQILPELKSGRLLSEVDLNLVLKEYPLAKPLFDSQAFQETKVKGIFSDYVIDGRKVNLPTLQALRLYPAKEYLYPYWDDRIISEGVNLWSITLLIKGPQIVEVVFGIKGTHTHVKLMSLRSLWHQPLEWTKTSAKAFGFWLKAETLDGCLPTWAIIIASAFTPDANNNIDYGVPFIDQSYNQSAKNQADGPGTFGL